MHIDAEGATRQSLLVTKEVYAKHRRESSLSYHTMTLPAADSKPKIAAVMCRHVHNILAATAAGRLLRRFATVSE